MEGPLGVYTFFVAIFVLFIPIVDWIAAFILKGLKDRAPQSIAVRERAVVALILAIVTTLNSGLAINRLTEGEYLPHPLPVILLSISVVLVSLPNIYWLWLFYTKRLKG